MIDAARERLDVRREAMRQENTAAPERLHLRDRENVSEWQPPSTPLNTGVDEGKTPGKDLGEGY